MVLSNLVLRVKRDRILIISKALDQLELLILVRLESLGDVHFPEQMLQIMELLIVIQAH